MVKQYIQQALVTAGLQSAGGIVLFGPDAALPHGSGTDRTLSTKEFVLMDVGGTLHGYHSDITRTFALENSDIKTIDLIVWFAVQEAQRAAHMVAINGSVASGVDKAARTILDQARYSQYFTHRLGHGTLWQSPFELYLSLY
jgi:Xaa-Pro aminopeptidase